MFSLLPKGQEELIVDITGATTPYFTTMDAHLIATRNKKILFQARIQGTDLNLPGLPAVRLPSSLPVRQIQVPETSLYLSLDNGGLLNGKLSLKGVNASVPGILKQPLTAERLRFQFSLSEKTHRFLLLPSRITYPSAEVGTVFNRDLGTGRTDITFSGKNVEIAQAREVCLPLLSGIRVSDRLFDILRGGRAKTISVGFSGPSLADLFDAKNMVIKGEAASARVKIPQTPLTADHVNARVTMNKGVLHIEPTQGHVRGSDIREGVLDIDLIRHHQVPFSGTFTLDSRLNDLPDTLSQLLPHTRLAEEMGLLSGVTGSTRAVLGLSMAPGQKALSVSVRATGIQASLNYQRIPMPVHIDRGEFTLDGDDIRVKEIAGSIGRSPFRNLTAAITIEETPRLHLTSAMGQFFIDDFMPWAASHPRVMNLIHPAREVSGTLDLDSLTIEGPMFIPERWRFSAAGSGQEMTVGFKDHPRSFESVSGRFDISQDQISATGIRALATDIGWLGFALDKERLNSLRLPLKILDSRVDKKGELSIHANLECPAGPTLSLDLSGTGLARLTPTTILLKDPGVTDALIIPYTDPKKPRFSFDGRIDTRTLDKIFKKNSAAQRILNRLTGGEDFTLSTGPESDLYLETGKIDLDVLFPATRKSIRQNPGTQAEQRPVSEAEKALEDQMGSRPLLSNKTLFFKAGQLTYLGRKFEDVDARIQFDPDATRIDIRKALLCGLDSSGQVNITFGGPAPRVDTRFSVSAQHREDIDPVMSCLFKKEGVINGAFSFSMDIAGKGVPDALSRNQDGSLSFKAEKGRIYKATLLNRVLSVINIIDVDLKQQGFAYKTFTVEADIRDSVIHLKKAYIDAENMAVLASGWIDPLNNKLDLTFLVAPFKTIDAIIKMIPVVNTLLKGRLVSLPARASGSISDPLVVPLAPSAVGKGLIDMLTDLVKAPVRLFQEDETP